MNAILLADCPDRPGLVADVATWIQRHGGNVLDLEQHVARDDDRFFLRAVWDRDGFDLSLDDARTAFATEIAGPAAMTWRLDDGSRRPRVALFVSRLSHCLFDLLLRIKKTFAFALAFDTFKKILPKKKPQEETFATILEGGLGPAMSNAFYFPYVDIPAGLS